MPNARPSADRLHVASLYAADVSDTVAVGDNAVANVGDDLHVGVAVKAKACSRRNLVVVPDDQAANRTMRGIAILTNAEVMQRLEPTDIATAKFCFSSYFDHGTLTAMQSTPT
jgi:hypothetical protein